SNAVVPSDTTVTRNANVSSACSSILDATRSSSATSRRMLSLQCTLLLSTRAGLSTAVSAQRAPATLHQCAELLVESPGLDAVPLPRSVPRRALVRTHAGLSLPSAGGLHWKRVLQSLCRCQRCVVWRAMATRQSPHA